MAHRAKHRKQTSKIAATFIGATTLLIALGLSATLNTSASAAQQASINLGTSQHFAVMAGSGITNTGPTNASGSYGADLGSSPTVAFTGNSVVTTTGTKYLSLDAATSAAKNDLQIAYDEAVSRSSGIPITTDLGNLTLREGVYNSASSIGISGPLTLDGENNPEAVFIFQAGSTLTTASASDVILINGAQPCNVFWQIGSSATFGTSSRFAGHVLALQSITAGNGAIFEGQLLALNGAVTLDTNSITNNGCAPVATANPTPVAPQPAPPVVASPVIQAPVTAPPVVAPPVVLAPVVAPPVVTPPVGVPEPVAAPVALAEVIPAEVIPAEVIPAAPAELSPLEEPLALAPTLDIVTETGGQLADTDDPNLKSNSVIAFGLMLIALGSAVFLFSRKA